MAYRKSAGILFLFGILAAVSAETLIFEDNFDSLDEGKWQHEITCSRGYNNEFEFYRKNNKNSYVKNGLLYLRPTFTADEYGEDFLNHGTLTDPACNQEPCTCYSGDEIVPPILSAKLKTTSHFAFTYGRLEVRAKMPKGDWTWPAIWLLPRDNAYGDWPRSGEIDIVEVRGNKNLFDSDGNTQGANLVGSTLHFGPDTSHHAYIYHGKTLPQGQYFSDDFHVFQLEWTDKLIRYTVDGQEIGRQDAVAGGFWKLGHFDEMGLGNNIWAGRNDMAPFDREFYIILNVAVGGNFFPAAFRNDPYPRPWNDGSTHNMREFWDARGKWMPTWAGEDSAMQVDYIRVYSY